MTDLARKLQDRYGVWGEHPDYPVLDWVNEVSNDDTRLGYWDWVAHQMSYGDQEDS